MRYKTIEPADEPEEYALPDPDDEDAWQALEEDSNRRLGED